MLQQKHVKNSDANAQQPQEMAARHCGSLEIQTQRMQLSTTGIGSFLEEVNSLNKASYSAQQLTHETGSEMDKVIHLKPQEPDEMIAEFAVRVGQKTRTGPCKCTVRSSVHNLNAASVSHKKF